MLASGPNAHIRDAELTRAGGGHDSDGLGGGNGGGGHRSGGHGSGGAGAGGGNNGSGSRSHSAGLARGSPLALRPFTPRGTPVVHSTSALGLHDTGEGRTGGESQKSDRLEHFEKLKVVP